MQASFVDDGLAVHLMVMLMFTFTWRRKYGYIWAVFVVKEHRRKASVRCM